MKRERNRVKESGRKWKMVYESNRFWFREEQRGRSRDRKNTVD